MDSKYIVNRLKTTLYKYPTAEVLKTRLMNIEESKRRQILVNLKMELHRECNVDIHEQLYDLVYRMPLAS